MKNEPEMAREGDGEGEHHQPIIRENLASLMQKRREEDRNRSFTVKLADAITAQIGTMTFVYIHALAVGAWIVLNKIWPVPGWVWDPSLVILATAASVEAIFLSTFILISQNKMQERADQRAELSLQISLLAERESTRLLEIVLAMAARLGVSHEASEEASELARSTDVLSILDEINRQQDG